MTANGFSDIVLDLARLYVGHCAFDTTIQLFRVKRRCYYWHILPTFYPPKMMQFPTSCCNGLQIGFRKLYANPVFLGVTRVGTGGVGGHYGGHPVRQ